MAVSYPWALWRLGLDTGRMLLEAQMVMSLRLLGMAGAVALPSSERVRMMTEKVPAFVEATGAAVSASMKGQPPNRVASAVLRPIARVTRANSKRLSARRRR